MKITNLIKQYFEYEPGLPLQDKEIAKRLNCSISAVCTFRNKNGIPDAEGRLLHLYRHSIDRQRALELQLGETKARLKATILGVIAGIVALIILAVTR